RIILDRIFIFTCLSAMPHDAIRARCHALATRIQQRVQAEHWDAARGTFTDEPAAQANGSGSLHVNTFAILAGAVDRKASRPLLDRALAAGARQAEWSGMRMWQHAGEFEVGLATLALQGIRRFWGFSRPRQASHVSQYTPSWATSPGRMA
ncbi:MAG: hypothetical protein ACOYOU_20375, partial [Kiritimatiellia bacterium]